jgi:hypothetical protein
MISPFPLKNAMLLMALAAIYPLQGHAAAGIAQFTTGDVTLRRNAATTALAKGGNIESGDAIVTGPTGRAQIRFSDGGLVALQPDSQFNITSYADRNDARQDSFLVDLLRGGMRSITGLIGKRNHANFKVTTTTATIGIRGSAFNLAYNADGTLSVSTEQDEIEVCTKAGCVGLTAGESAQVFSNDELATRTNARASLPIPAPRQDPEVAGNQVNAQGRSSIITLPPPRTNPPTQPTAQVLTGVALTSSGLTGEGTDQRLYTNGSLVLTANGDPDGYLAAGNAAQGARNGTASIISSSGSLATGDYLLLGTWSGSTWTEGGNTLSVGASAFVAGMPAPSTAVAAMTGQRGNYALISASPVFSSTGAIGTLLPTSTLTVDFLGVGNYANVSLDVQFPSSAGLQQPTALASPSTTSYNLRGSGIGTGSGFSGTLSVSSDACTWGYAACGTGSFTGFLSGPNAAQAGLSYNASSDAHGNFGGAAIFSQSSQSATPQNIGVTGLASSYSYGASSSGFYMPSYYGGSFYSPNENDTIEFVPDPGDHKFNGERLTGFEAGMYSYVRQAGTQTAEFGSIGKITDGDFIGWGRWVQGQASGGNYYGSGSVMLDQVHYIVGTPTPAAQMPVTGSASYALIGGTAPTATLDGVSQVGQLLGGSLTANFTSSSVQASIDTRFGNTQVNISNQYGAIYGASISGCGTNGNITGFFSGAAAYRAGLVYNRDVEGLGNVAGAAAFQRTSTLLTAPR